MIFVNLKYKFASQLIKSQFVVKIVHLDLGETDRLSRTIYVTITNMAIGTFQPWMCCKDLIPDQKMVPVQSNNNCLPGKNAQKTASGLLPGLWGPLNTCSSVYRTVPVWPLM